MSGSTIAAIIFGLVTVGASAAFIWAEQAGSRASRRKEAATRDDGTPSGGTPPEGVGERLAD
ncbi:MAG: hypothetical protein ACRDGI_10800 [Candidatus Limnocylindrales bacterium]